MGSRFNRGISTKNQQNFIYIFTEGKKTEPIYFNFKKSQIRKNNIKIEIKGKGKNTISLVDSVLKFIKRERINPKIDECWVVFDKDDCKENFNLAIESAEKNDLKVAYSNEAFELWFLLHFVLIESTIKREDYNQKITENYKKLTNDNKYKYDKKSDKCIQSLITLIRNKEIFAIKNAKKLLNQYKNEKSYLKKNPSTTIHILVERINSLKS